MHPRLSRLLVLVVSYSYVVGMNQGKLDAAARLERVYLTLLMPIGW